MSEDVVATDELTVTLLQQPLHVGRVAPDNLKGCSWPLLKCLFFHTGSEDEQQLEESPPGGFFSLTQEEDELTLVMDARCRAAFDEAKPSGAEVQYASSADGVEFRWRAFELHLGSLAWEVPGLVCFLATLMAEAKISILNLSSHDRDFLLVQEGDVPQAKKVIQQRLQQGRVDADGLKESIAEKASVRRSGTFSSLSAVEQELELLEIEAAAELAANGGGGANGAAADSNGAHNGNGAAAATNGNGNGSAANGNGSSQHGGESSSSSGGGAAAAAAGGGGGGGGGIGGAGGGGGGGIGGMKKRVRSKDLLAEKEELVVKVLPTRLAVVRLQASMLQPSAHALVHRLLFAPSKGTRCFWSYTQVKSSSTQQVQAARRTQAAARKPHASRTQAASKPQASSKQEHTHTPLPSLSLADRGRD